MQKVAAQEYEYSQIKDTLKEIGQTVEEKLDQIGESIDRGFWTDLKNTVSGWFESIGDWFSGIFSNKEEELGILGQTNDQLLGDDVVVDATEEEAIAPNTDATVEEKGFFEKIWDWFKGLFSNQTTDDKTNQTELESNTQTENVEETIIGGGEIQTEENKEVEKDKTNTDTTNNTASDNIQTEENSNQNQNDENKEVSEDSATQNAESPQDTEIKN